MSFSGNGIDHISQITSTTGPRELWGMVLEEFHCDHQETIICWRGEKTRQYVKQCQRCGHTSSAIAYAEIPEKVRNDAPPVDYEFKEQLNPAMMEYRRKLHEHADNLRNAERKEKFEAKRADMQHDYMLWRRRPEWHEQRSRVLRRDGYICQACNSNQAVEVHHMTYKYHPHTPDYLLQSICRQCHERITAVDKGGTL